MFIDQQVTTNSEGGIEGAENHELTIVHKISD